MRARRWRWGLLAAASILLAGFFALPVVSIEAPSSTVLTDRHGALLGATTARDEQWRFPPASTVPERFAAALITFEDRRFRQHPGVDPFAVLRAIHLNLQAGEVRSGASTLTMQTVRVARGNPPHRGREAHRDGARDAPRSGPQQRRDPPCGRPTPCWAATWYPAGGSLALLRAAGRHATGRSRHPGRAATAGPDPPRPQPGRAAGQDHRLLDAMVRGLLSVEDASLAKAEPLPEAPPPIPQAAPHLLMKLPGQHTETTLDRATCLHITEIVERHEARLAGNVSTTQRPW